MATSVYTSLLTKDYKRKAGEIKALRKELRDLAKAVIEREKELAAIKTILLSRDPNINIDEIRSISTYPKVLGMKWNKLTGLILRCLREANGGIVASNYITEYVIECSDIEVKDRLSLAVIQSSISDRLRGLRRAGKVIRHHEQKTSVYGLWSLPSGE